MIDVHISYHNILRRHAGVEGETLHLPDGTSLYTALQHLAGRYGPHLREMLFAPGGTVSSHLVIFRNEQLTRQDPQTVELMDGDQVMLFPAISGG